jgi:D-lactate dehydrogenase
MNCFHSRVKSIFFGYLMDFCTDIISLHVPLTKETHHIINEAALEKVKKGVMLINTSRGALIDSNSLIGYLKNGKIGYLGIDVYEGEASLFYNDMSVQIIKDDVTTNSFSLKFL